MGEDSDNSSTNPYLRELIECSDTWLAHRVANTPRQPETFAALWQLRREILEPLRNEFGSLRITYGFCSDALRRKIKKGISPAIDQHAGYELDSGGRRICDRGGVAADFFVPDVDSLVVAQWVAANTPFDRLYFYGGSRPVHASVSPHPVGQVVLMTKLTAAGRKVPRVTKSSDFLKNTYGRS